MWVASLGAPKIESCCFQDSSPLEVVPGSCGKAEADWDGGDLVAKCGVVLWAAQGYEPVPAICILSHRKLFRDMCKTCIDRCLGLLFQVGKKQVPLLSLTTQIVAQNPSAFSLVIFALSKRSNVGRKMETTTKQRAEMIFSRPLEHI